MGNELFQDIKSTSHTQPAILVERYQSGDFGAFDDIVERYHNRVYRLAYHFARNCEDAYDISQEVFIKVLRSLGDLKNGSAFDVWLKKITINTCIDYLRQRPSQQVLDDFSYVCYRRAVGGCVGSPDSPMEMDELSNVISEAVDQLPMRQRKVFILRHYEDLSIKEIAEALNRTQGTVKANLFHANRKLRKLLLSYVS